MHRPICAVAVNMVRSGIRPVCLPINRTCSNIALEDDIIMAIWSCVGYTVLLCFTLFKTGSLAKSVFQAH